LIATSIIVVRGARGGRSLSLMFALSVIVGRRRQQFRQMRRRRVVVVLVMTAVVERREARPRHHYRLKRMKINWSKIIIYDNELGVTVIIQLRL
jgi:hypothetical protein